MATLDPHIQEQLSALPKGFDFVNLEKSDPTFKHADRFTLLVPYCNEHLSWEVLFNGKEPYLPADFVFSFYFCDFLDVDVYSSFAQTVLKLKELYKKHQERLMSEIKDEFILFQYETVKGIKEIEYHVLKDTIRMLIPVFDGVRLYVVFNPQVSHKQLVIDADSDVNNVNLPQWRKETCLLDYVMQIQELIVKEKQILQLESKMKSDFMKGLMETFGSPLDLEEDMICFLCDGNGFYFVLFVTLTNFPKETPIVQMQAIQHLDKNGAPIRCRIPNVPYSSSWTREENLKRLKDKIKDNVKDFHDICIKG